MTLQLDHLVAECRRQELRRREALRERFRSGEALCLWDVVDAYPDDDYSRLPGARFDLVAAACAGDAIVGTALGVDPAEPLTRKPIPAGAWHSARPVAGDFEFTAIDVLGGVRLHAVEIALADASASETVSREAGVSREAAGGGGSSAENDLSDDPACGRPPLPNAMEAAARLIVERGHPVSLGECRQTFAAFGIDLTEDGTSVMNASTKVDGLPKSVSGGRPPSLVRLFVVAVASKLIDDDPACGQLSARALARKALDLVEPLVPHLDFPPPKGAANFCAALVERSGLKKTVGI